MDIVKTAIDNISSTGIAYKNNHRTATKGLVLLSCTPCIIFSGLIRLLSCPFQCLCNKDICWNPIGACLIDSHLTMPSDRCIISAVEKVDIIIRTPISDIPMTLYEEIEVLKYAASMIQTTTNIRNRYAIANFVKYIMLKHSTEVNSTPASVIIAAEKLSAPQRRLIRQSLHGTY